MITVVDIGSLVLLLWLIGTTVILIDLFLYNEYF